LYFIIAGSSNTNTKFSSTSFSNIDVQQRQTFMDNSSEID